MWGARFIRLFSLKKTATLMPFPDLGWRSLSRFGFRRRPRRNELVARYAFFVRLSLFFAAGFSLYRISHLQVGKRPINDFLSFLEKSSDGASFRHVFRAGDFKSQSYCSRGFSVASIF